MYNLDFQKLHQQIWQTYQLKTVLSEENKRQKNDVENTIREILIEKRYFLLYNTWYPKMNEKAVQTFLNSTLFQKSNQKIFNSPLDLPFSFIDIKKINEFMKNITNNIPLIIKCSNRYFEKGVGSIPQNNLSINPLTFFASSTLPALFGYGWCVEQANSYINALCLFVELQLHSSNSVNSSSFKNSYVRELIKYFFQLFDVQHFLQLTISNIYQNLLADHIIQSFPNFDDINFFIALSPYLSAFITSICENLHQLCSPISYFIHKVYNIAVHFFGPQSNEPRSLLEFIIFDLILQPPFANPKLFALISETAVNPNRNPAIYIDMAFHWAFDKSKIPQKFNQLAKNEAFLKVNPNPILDFFVNYHQGLNGIFCKTIEDFSQHPSNILLYSLNDLIFLQIIIKENADALIFEGEPRQKLDRLKSLFGFKAKISDPNSLIEFWFSDTISNIPNQELNSNDISSSLPLDLHLFFKASKPEADPDLDGLVDNLINYLIEIKPAIVKRNMSNSSNFTTILLSKQPVKEEPKFKISQKVSSFDLGDEISNDISDYVDPETNYQYLLADKSLQNQQNVSFNKAVFSDFDFNSSILDSEQQPCESKLNSSFQFTTNQRMINQKNAVPGIISFLELRSRIAQENNLAEEISKLKALNTKIRQYARKNQISISSAELSIFKNINNLINYKVWLQSSCLRTNLALQSLRTSVSDMHKRVIEMRDEVSPIVEQSILKLFQYRHVNFELPLDSPNTISRILTCYSDWNSYFEPLADALENYNTKDLHCPSKMNFGLKRQLHTSLVSKFSTQMIETYVPKLKEDNNRLVQQYDRLFVEFKKDNFSKPLKQLFSTEVAFQPSIEMLSNGIQIGSPIERIQKISNVLNTLQDLFFFEAGEKCPGDDLLPLVMYTLLRAKIPNLMTISYYLDFFLLQCTLKIITSKESYVATTFVSAVNGIFSRLS